MIKKTKKIAVTLVTTLAFIAYAILITNNFALNTAHAHEPQKENYHHMQASPDCEDDQQNCEQDQSGDCEGCQNFNSCHSELMLIPASSAIIINSSKHTCPDVIDKYKKMYYQPTSPPS